jgi:hypothetical protein
MRKSLEDIKHMVEMRFYPNPIPDELIPYHAYIRDCGHSIMCVLECHLSETNGNYDDYELPVPVKYVLEKGYRIQNGYVIVDAEYNEEYGLMVDDQYTEW